MSQSSANLRLSQIQTLWSTICRAKGEGPRDVVNAAQERLLDRYGKVVHRYLLGALRDSDAADELSQEFALRFLRGDLKGADQQRGRFRDFLKGVLFHLIADFHRRKKKDVRALPSDVPWLSLSAVSGDVDAHDAASISVTLDPSVLAAGHYEAALCIGSNDPQHPRTVVPVRFDIGDALFTDGFDG